MFLFGVPEYTYALDSVSIWGWGNDFGLSQNNLRTKEYLLNNNGIANGYILNSSNQVVKDEFYIGDAVTLGYFGSDIFADVSVAGKVPDRGSYSLDKGDIIHVKNIGVYKGKALEIVMKVEASNRSFLRLKNDRNISPLEYSVTNNIQQSYDISYHVIEQITKENIPGLKVLFPVDITDRYKKIPDGKNRSATLFSPNSKFIMKEGDLGLAGLYRKPSKADSATHFVQQNVKGGGEGPASINSISVYSDASESIAIGLYNPDENPPYATNFLLFDPNVENFSAQSYSNVKLEYVDNKKGQLDFTIKQNLPYQALDVYFPQELVLDYSKETADLSLTEPDITFEDKKINRNEYEYKNGKFIFSNTFLMKYHADAEKKNSYLNIEFTSKIDYNTKQTMAHHQSNSKNFEYVFPIHSKSKSINPANQSIIESTEADFFKNVTVSYPLELKATDLKGKVNLDSTISDYGISEFVDNISSNFPNDSAKIIVKNNQLKFDTLGPIDVPFILKSTLLNVEQEFIAKVTVVSEPITSEYFENQAWLINEINKQFASKGKKIDVNLYMRDLLEIKSIVNRTGADFNGQHIPKTIASLKNLEVIDLGSKRLIGTLPEELGQLSKLKKLSIFGNTFSGEIPRSLSKLENLESLTLGDNNLSGTVPPGLEKLATLKQVYLNKNQLIGSIPLFDLGPFSNFDIGETQLTYNENKSPSFISKVAQYKQSFVVGTDSLSLTSNINLAITSNGTTIKPFDPTDRGFLNLQAQKKNMTNVELYSGHTFKIIHKKSGKILYDGLAVKTKEIKVDSGEIYQVVMDNADKNPNNITEFETKLREYKLSGVPKNLSLDLKLGELDYEPIKISSKDTLSIFDNRLNSKWQLKVKASELKSVTRTMSGSFYYKSATGSTVAIPADNSFKTIESGKSDPATGTIDVSKDWNDKQGLFYKQGNTGNYKDAYAGKLEWQIVDAPTG
ncbi:hypothetical protein RV15_GL002345 [Enterococcus silesiacus]|uniref:WxL domain-containing protein n=1 Tax=Enterococcus silesiacus TaxID=332949 RepID=A0AA91JMX1_9ENTE|nr:hypothetical protein RV15_GL002345 [Enterococcus silesiacus]